MKARTLCVVSLVLAGCTSVQVEPVAVRPELVCIQENPAVWVKDFLPVVRAGFARHGVPTETYAQVPRQCPYVLEYTARQTWDMAPYLSVAELTIRDASGRRVGQADYHLRGKGGLSLMKWQGTAAKLNPVIDELMGQMRPALVARSSSPVALTATPAALTFEDELAALQARNLGYQAYSEQYHALRQRYGLDR